MLDFRVRDLYAMLAQLRSKGADVDEEVQDMDGVGLFGWVTDPEGNRIEIWELRKVELVGRHAVTRMQAQVWSALRVTSGNTTPAVSFGDVAPSDQKH